jgi:hypothetical protein
MPNQKTRKRNGMAYTGDSQPSLNMSTKLAPFFSCFLPVPPIHLSFGFLSMLLLSTIIEISSRLQFPTNSKAEFTTQARAEWSAICCLRFEKGNELDVNPQSRSLTAVALKCLNNVHKVADRFLIGSSRTRHGSYLIVSSH